VKIGCRINVIANELRDELLAFLNNKPEDMDATDAVTFINLLHVKIVDLRRAISDSKRLSKSGIKYVDMFKPHKPTRKEIIKLAKGE